MKYGVLFIFVYFGIGVFWTFQPGVDTSSIFGFSVYLFLGTAFCYFDDLRVISVLFYLYIYMCIDFSHWRDISGHLVPFD